MLATHIILLKNAKSLMFGDNSNVGDDTVFIIWTKPSSTCKN